MPNDRDIQRAFDQLRCAEVDRVPPFEDVFEEVEGRALLQGRLRRRTRRALQLAVAMAFACAVAVAWWGDGERGGGEIGPLSASTGPSIVSWEAPTDRLLRPLWGDTGLLDWSSPTDPLLRRPGPDPISIRPLRKDPIPEQ